MMFSSEYIYCIYISMLIIRAVLLCRSFTSQTSGIPTLIVAVSDDSPSNSDLIQEGQKFAGQSDDMDFMKGLPNFMQHSE